MRIERGPEYDLRNLRRAQFFQQKLNPCIQLRFFIPSFCPLEQEQNPFFDYVVVVAHSPAARLSGLIVPDRRIKCEFGLRQAARLLESRPGARLKEGPTRNGGKWRTPSLTASFC